MKCRICGNDTTVVLTSKLRRGEGVVYYCPNCDYGMLRPKFEKAKKYYNEEYRQSFKDDLTSSKEESPEEIYEMRCEYQKDRLAIMKDFFDTEKSLLEIGSSAGQFLSKVKSEFQYVAGIELSEECAKYTTLRWNIPIYTKELSQIEWNGFQFDYVAFFQVLEHIENPKEFLKDVSKCLKNNGKVFIEVPSLDDPLRTLWNVPAYEGFYYHEAHLSYFSEKSIRRILEECGYRIEEIYFIQDYNLLNHIYWYFNNKPQPTCEFGLSIPKIDFEKGSNQREIVGVREAGDEINGLLAETNNRYFEILSKYHLTSNMLVVASKK